eukprot:scaffold106236_cov29-Tisochrysis_lutea.AAC.4
MLCEVVKCAPRKGIQLRKVLEVGDFAPHPRVGQGSAARSNGALRHPHPPQRATEGLAFPLSVNVEENGRRVYKELNGGVHQQVPPLLQVAKLRNVPQSRDGFSGCLVDGGGGTICSAGLSAGGWSSCEMQRGTSEGERAGDHTAPSNPLRLLLEDGRLVRRIASSEAWCRRWRD